MKSPVFILTALLPLAAQVAVASPVADPDSSLEERGGNNNWNNGGKDWGGNHQGPQDNCKIKNPFWWHKYPCDSSSTVGQARVGDTFAPVCKYQNWYQNAQGWWARDDNKPPRCGRQTLFSNPVQII
ncbi:hypothetical protein N7509_007903 [Penicillium cosmopolitanum]|uniref:Uncharacterized protein n=1 Tax=Penicillium cosmopolitanum TaxID=1131564 RepID=A0A9W9VZT0_9EURO|nr:uncharacterized protein N7509_007903 [Penicillium cosmopolitanum]KAJ5392413.1 hypothetical protein N7509_007903 [Penicillium cosmopolitanum]